MNQNELKPDARFIELNNGLKMPVIGLGVWRAHEESENAIRQALSCGCRLIDTAKCYRNEPETGKAVRTSGIPREEVFVTTKIWVDAIREGKTKEHFEQSLASMGLDYVDLLLLHWPVNGWKEAWKDLEEIYRGGKAKAIGVSNFREHHLEELFEISDVVPAVNQIEYNLQDQEPELLQYCRDHGITVEAYSPLGRGESLHHPALKALSEVYHKSPAQILLRWLMDKGIVPLPKSVHADRIASNLDVSDFELDPEDAAILDALNEHKRQAPEPDVSDELL